MTGSTVESAWWSEPEDPRERAIADDVRAELEHHLACAADDLITGGLAAENAQREAELRFGDVTAVHRTCVRIRARGIHMKQRLHFALTVSLAMAVLALAAWNVHSRRVALAQADRAMALAQELQALLHRDLKPEPVDHIVVGVGDQIELSDRFHPELVANQRVAADGKILVPELGWFHVAGLTREAAEAALTEEARKYYEVADIKLRVE